MVGSCPTSLTIHSGGNRVGNGRGGVVGSVIMAGRDEKEYKEYKEYEDEYKAMRSTRRYR